VRAITNAERVAEPIAEAVVQPGLAARPSQAFVAATTYRRLELKYWATELQAAALLRLTKPHLELDPYCLKGAQRNVSLYLDTPTRTFYDAHLASLPDRHKLRIRTYDEGANDGPAFLEVKRKVKAITAKCRVITSRALARAVVRGQYDEALAMAPDNADLAEFVYLAQQYQVEPSLLIAADRLSLISADDGGQFRMTLDRDIRFQRPFGTELQGLPRAWTPLDIWELNGDPSLVVMVEMKCAEYAPAWLAPVLAQLGLARTSFSKYIASMTQDSLDTDVWAPLAQRADGRG
jgi:hypothetical protein